MSAHTSEENIACFSVSADAGPGVLPRILDYFAKRGLVPYYLKSERSGDGLAVEIHVTDMEMAQARYIARCLERIFEIHRVLVSEKRYADVA